MEEAAEKPKCCSPAWCKANTKQLVILLLIVLLIVFVVVDTVSKGCTTYEKSNIREHRIRCELGEVALNSSKFVCSSPKEPKWRVFTNPQRCGKSDGCLTAGIEVFFDWLGNNVAGGFFVFFFVYVLACVLFIPGTILTIGAGVAFGGALGLGPGLAIAALAVWSGALTGASVAMIIGRYVFRSWVESLKEQWTYIKVIDEAVRLKGFLTVLLLRFSPVIPFNLFNYLMGATGVDFKHYFLGSAFGMLPGTVAYVFIGAFIGSAARGGGDMQSCDSGSATVTIIFGIVGGIFTVVAVALIAYVSKKQLDNILAENGKANDQEGKANDQEAT